MRQSSHRQLVISPLPLLFLKFFVSLLFLSLSLNNKQTSFNKGRIELIKSVEVEQLSLKSCYRPFSSDCVVSFCFLVPGMVEAVLSGGHVPKSLINPQVQVSLCVGPYIVVSSHSSSTSPGDRDKCVEWAQGACVSLSVCLHVVYLPWRPGSPFSPEQSSWQTRWIGCCLCCWEVPVCFDAGRCTGPDTQEQKEWQSAPFDFHFINPALAKTLVN